MGNWTRVWLGVAAVVTACAASAVAVAASGYSISKITVPSSVEARSVSKTQGKGFQVTVQGFAQKQSALDVYLDYRKCPASANKEAKQDSLYTANYSFFAGPSSVSGFAVTGSFKESFTAHPGGKTGKRYVCAYLTSSTSGPSGVQTKAFKSAAYQVTK